MNDKDEPDQLQSPLQRDTTGNIQNLNHQSATAGGESGGHLCSERTLAPILSQFHRKKSSSYMGENRTQIL